MLHHVQSRLLRHILAGERRSATAIVEDWAKTYGYEQAITQVLEPTLAAFGEKWATAEDVSLAQGYVAGKVAEDIMENAAAARASGPVEQESKGPVVIANIEDDCHVLGRRLVTIFLRLDGWKVYDLGEDVPAGEYVDKAVEVGAPLIGASAMMYRTAVNIKRLRAEIDRRGLAERIQLAVGGAVLLHRPELVTEVGGDGTASNALAAPALMARLLAKTRSERSEP